MVRLGGGEDEFVKFEAVFAHGEVDVVETGVWDVDPDFSEDAGVDFFSALLAVPCPLIFFSPLHAGTRLRPSVIEPEVDAIILGIGRVGADPAVVAPSVIKVDGVGEDGHLAGGVGEVFLRDELVTV